MKTRLIAVFILLMANSLFGQTVYEEFNSFKLGERRQIKIQLPRNYNANEDKVYPLFIVLDGDYLFEVVAGNVDYYSYWEDMPEAIVVGINQVEKRDEDNYYSEQNSIPIETGARFFEFIGMELIPHLIGNYRLAEFRVIVGHGETANFINYFLLKDQPIFHAYIGISPILAPDMFDYLSERLPLMKNKTFYYLATSDKDIKAAKEDSESLNNNFSRIDNKNFLYTYDSFEGPTHYSNPMYAIPNALESIFFVFQPIGMEEYQERILTLKTSPVDYLLDKYRLIKEMFGIKKQILINDFKAIDAAIEKNKTYEYFQELGKIASKEYPDTLLGSYYLARYYEENGDPKKAMRIYRSAFVLEEIAGLTKELMMEKAEQIKADFGY